MDHFAGLNHKATSQALNDKLTKMANNHCKSQQEKVMESGPTRATRSHETARAGEVRSLKGQQLIVRCRAKFSTLEVKQEMHLSQSREWPSISEAERKADQRQTRCFHIREQVAMDSESKRLFEPSTPETGSRVLKSLSQNGKG